MTNAAVTIKTIASVRVAYVPGKGPYSQVGGVMGRLFGWLGRSGHAPAGPVAGAYFNAPGSVPDAELRWEIRCPVGSQVALMELGPEGVGVKDLPTVEVAATIHKGPYDTVGNTYGTLMGWIAQNGYQLVGPAEEVYLNDPQNTAPQELLTEVRLPVGKV